ncbi:MAG: permease [Fermentimonas sp.]|nr:permease [Fermentimonas sp.]
METKKELKYLVWLVLIFGLIFFLPLSSESFMTAIYAALDLSKWYAREHVILCLLPAFFIAGVIAVFISKGSVMRYFGANAKKWLSYTVASVSGAILAVCSCTILPLFTSIYKRGAGLGPAIAFLYSGPAISILSIILTWSILGTEMGIARMIGAILFAVIIGLIMAFIFRKEEKVKQEEQINFEAPPAKRPISHTMLLFFTLVLIMVFANWGAPESGDTSSVWFFIFSNKWYITGLLGLLLAYSLIKVLKIKWQWVILGVIATALSAFLTNRFISDNKMTPMVPMLVGVAALSIITLFDKNDEENKEWTLSAWGFTKQIMPLLAIGVVITGFLLGSTHDNVAIPGVVPNEWVEWAVGGNSLLSNFFASIAGAFMYFATLTEVPIVQGLLASGMGKGPALALLLAGPSVSLPNMLVIRGVMGTKKTVTYIALVVIMATLTGMVYGNFFKEIAIVN